MRGGGRGGARAPPPRAGEVRYHTHRPEWGSVEIARGMIDLVEEAVKIGVPAAFASSGIDDDEERDERLNVRRYVATPPVRKFVENDPRAAAAPIPEVDAVVFLSETCLPVATVDEVEMALFGERPGCVDDDRDAGRDGASFPTTTPPPPPIRGGNVVAERARYPEQRIREAAAVGSRILRRARQIRLEGRSMDIPDQIARPGGIGRCDGRTERPPSRGRAMDGLSRREGFGRDLLSYGPLASWDHKISVLPPRRRRRPFFPPRRGRTASARRSGGREASRHVLRLVQ